MSDTRNKFLPVTTVLLCSALGSGAVLGQEDGSEIEEVVVTGLRGQPRTVTDSPVPVDVFSTSEIERSSQTDTLEVLQTLVPSFSTRRAANTTSDSFIRSPTMRGLPASQSLLLVNSRRRHKSASVGVSGYGAQASDAAVIPATAIQSVEVLRDGAAAQYGSDAIAGVINFNLKDSPDGGSLSVQRGRYYEGDGDGYVIAGNLGLPLTQNGFVNISAEIMDSERTIRSAQFTSPSWNAIDEFESNPIFREAVGNLDEPLERVGKPIEEAARFVVNSGIDLSPDSEVYLFGNGSRSKGTAAATYRVPGAGHQVMDNPIRLDDGSEWRFKDMYPAGMRPEFTGKVTDWSIASGYRNQMQFSNGQRLDMDVGVRYGWSEIAYSMVQTVNPSMGPDSQLEFQASSYVSDEMAVNGDFVYEKEVGAFAGPLIVNFGFEYRDEGFEIKPGEHASYSGGAWAAPDPFGFCTDDADLSDRVLRPGAPTDQGIDCTDGGDPVYNILQPGSNGITGLSPDVSGKFNSDSRSLYVEGSADVTDDWFVDLALRFEDYDAFGSKTVGKLATRYQLSDAWAVRGSVGTGFRAPTTGQLNMTQTQIQTVGGVPLNTGLYAATNPVAQFLGAEALRPEESVSYSMGLTFTPGNNFTLTIDAYRINLKDQVYRTSYITVTPEIEEAMIEANITGAGTIDSIAFYQNAFDSRVDGIDIVGTYRLDWNNGHSTSFTGSLNRNSYKIENVNISSVIFDQVSIYNFENNDPDWRANLTFTHEVGSLVAMLRGNFFGPYSRQTTAEGNAIQDYSTIVQFDAELVYSVNQNLSLSVGGRNIFDKYPDVNKIDQTNGRLYFDGPADWQGGYYFGRVSYDF